MLAMADKPGRWEGWREDAGFEGRGEEWMMRLRCLLKYAKEKGVSEGGGDRRGAGLSDGSAEGHSQAVASPGSS